MLTISTQKMIYSPTLLNNLTLIDFDEIFSGCEQSRLLKVSNHSEFEISFGTSVEKLVKETAAFFSISPNFGKIPPFEDTLLEIKFSPKQAFKTPIQRTNFLGVISFLNGPIFGMDLRGRVAANPIAISPEMIDFGAQFIKKIGLGCATRSLEIFNKSPAKPVYISYISSTLHEFECDLRPQLIEPSSSVKTNITFCPSSCKKYEGKMYFQLNEKVKIMAPVSGRGVELELGVQPGRLTINQKGEGASKRPSKVHEHKVKRTPNVHLGDLISAQSSRCTVSVTNESSVPIQISAATILPKSKELNEVHTESRKIRQTFAEIISLKLLRCPSHAQSCKTKEKGSAIGSICYKEPSAQIEVSFNSHGRPIDPFHEDVMLRISTQNNPEKQIWIRGFTISGKCTAVSVVADTLLVNFGTLVHGSSLTKSVVVSNYGNKIARYRTENFYNYFAIDLPGQRRLYPRISFLSSL